MPRFSYGWKPSPPDARDEKFKFRAEPHIVAALPPAFNLVGNSPGAPFDPALVQQSIGSCGPHSLAKNIIYDELKVSGGNAVPSRLFLYYTARMLMGTIGQDSGVENRVMLQALAKYGWCDESLWPYDVSKFTQRPPQACFDQAAQRAGQVKYQKVDVSLSTMKACLYQTGRPFIWGGHVFPEIESDEVGHTGEVPDPSGFDRPVGGHDVLFVGWDDARQRFIFQNHWELAPGKLWGNRGYGTLSYKYSTNPQLAGDFWTVPMIGALTPPEPKPQPVPSPSAAWLFGARITLDGKTSLKITGLEPAGPWPPTS